MATRPFGRTNRSFPTVWFSPIAGAEDLTILVEALQTANAPIDVSSSPGFWGEALRSSLDLPLICLSSRDLERATEAAHAADLIRADLIATLSSIGRETIDFYFLRSRIAYQEFQLSGALEAIEMVRQDGHIRYLGLWAEGAEADTLANWRFHDAFESVCLEGAQNGVSLEALAKERRAGIVYRVPAGSPKDHTKTVLTPVHSAQEVVEATK